MQVGIPTETSTNERRVAAVPATVKVFDSWGLEVSVQSGAGEAAGFDDQAYVDAGAVIVNDSATAHGTDIVLRVGPPTAEDISKIPSGSILISFLDPFQSTDLINQCAQANISAVAVEAVPRTTLAQAMDALSSQATAVGYSAVLLAATESPKLIPMLVTAAGTIRPSRVLILGVGVAGLQAIATAKRLGAIVHAYDIRPETREQVESLGAKFIEAPTVASDKGGYAREVDEATAAAQRQVLANAVADANVVITTAQVPGRRAPVLVTADMVAAMAPGSIIIDGAAASGGNVEGSAPDETIETGGVRIFGPTDLASRVATDASAMYSRNVQELLGRMRTEDDNNIILLLQDDEVVGPCTITHSGEVVHPRSREAMGLEPLSPEPSTESATDSSSSDGQGNKSGEDSG